MFAVTACKYRAPRAIRAHTVRYGDVYRAVRDPFDFSAGKYEERRDAPGAEIKLVCPFAMLFVERPIYLMARVTPPSPNRLPFAQRTNSAIGRCD